MRFKLTPPPPRSKSNPDDYLPIAQTCFFSLSVPEYSSKEVTTTAFYGVIHENYSSYCNEQYR
jgi:hypothetical protein